MKIIIILLTIVLASCSSGNSGSGGGSNGQLSFNQSSYQVTANSVTEVDLGLNGSTNAAGASVTIASSNSNVAVIVNNTCILSDESGFPSSCEIIVKGVATGNAMITASAAGIAIASATVNVTNDVVAGTLAFTPSIESITLGSDKRVAVTLNGSSGVNNLQVNLSSSNSVVADPLHSSCILSSLERSCNIIIDGNNLGSASITASASGYAAVVNSVNVINESIPGSLTFSANKQLQVGNSEEATLSLVGSSGVSGLTVSLNTENSDVTVSPSTCTLSSNKPDCHIKITGASVGNDRITAMATGYDTTGTIIDVVSTPVKGSLYFSASSESVAVNSSANVELLYTGGSGVESLVVALNANNQNATISPARCAMNNTHGGSSCKITISGVTLGQTIITATAAGYPDVSNTINVVPSGIIAYGNLILKPKNSDITKGSALPMTLSLVGSSNVNNLVVNLVSSASGIATLSTTTCTLSTISNTCFFTVTGQESGSAIITASNSHIINSETAAVTVTAKAGTYLTFTPDKLILSNQNKTAQTATLTLVNASASPVRINFQNEPSAIQYSPAFCSLSATSPSCVVNINNAVIGGSTGTFAFVATPSDTSIATDSLPVILAAATAIPRTITVINKCPFTVYAGISGGSANLTKGTKPGTCPTGSIDAGGTDANGYELCYWKNPIPASGSYKLTPQNQQTTFIIPTSSLDTVGTMWGGGIMARLKLNESWIIGDCTGGSTTVGDACKSGVGFSIPETVAEFTLTPEGVDTYDMQLIDGVTIPTSITPNGVTPDSANPYTNGVAGSTQQQTGSQYTLFASSWEFTPTTQGVTDSTTYYNYVTGVAGSTDQCTSDSACSGNVNGPVCGYAANSVGGSAPTYARICGYRLAYLTAASIYALNPGTSNVAPFDFNSVLYNVSQSAQVPYPNSNGNPMHDFYLCNAGAAQSGYQAATTYPNACGCANWDTLGIATPTTQCKGTGVTSYTATTTGIGFNSAWINEVLPRVKWIKQGCPTCYSFQYDDPSSTFEAYAPASSSNAANAESYTVTFCPGGKYLPNYDPNLNN